MMFNTNLHRIGSVYNAIYQGNMAMFNRRLNRSLFPPQANMALQGFPQLSFGDAQYITNIRESSNALSSALRELSGQAFSARTITSSNNDVVSVAFSGNRPSSADSMEVIVSQVARGHETEGESLSANAQFDGQHGRNTISISMGGRTTQVSVNIAQDDTNRIAQRRMADAINSANLGVRASVETDSQTNQSVLRIESTATGSNERNSFTVTDFLGDFAQRLGIDGEAAAGQDAIFSVNGELHTSQTNIVILSSGVTATLRQSSDEAISIGPGRDQSAIRSTINDMVRSFNNLFAAAAENTSDTRAQDLSTRLLNTSRIYTRGLSEIGISFDDSGRMRIDNERMNQAVESGRLEQFFTENAGLNFGFSNQLGRLADNVSRNPANFATNSLFGGSLSGNFGYSGFGSLMHFNSLAAGSLMNFLL